MWSSCLLSTNFSDDTGKPITEAEKMAPGTKSKEQSDKTLSAINILGKEKDRKRKGYNRQCIN